MDKQLFWEDIKAGAEITPLSKIATSVMLVKWAGAYGDFVPLHYEDHFAATRGVGRPIIHGALKRQWLIQMVTDWMGEQGTLRKFSCQYRAVDYPRLMISHTDPEKGQTWWCKGTITSAYTIDGQNCVDCNIWIENDDGEKTTKGSATIVLPSRDEPQI